MKNKILGGLNELLIYCVTIKLCKKKSRLNKQNILKKKETTFNNKYASLLDCIFQNINASCNKA